MAEEALALFKVGDRVKCKIQSGRRYYRGGVSIFGTIISLPKASLTFGEGRHAYVEFDYCNLCNYADPPNIRGRYCKPYHVELLPLASLVYSDGYEPVLTHREFLLAKHYP